MRVAGEVHDGDGDTPEIDLVAVGEPRGIRPRHVVELVHEHRSKMGIDIGLHAIDRHQAVERVHASHVVLVDVDPGVGEQVDPGEVVLVRVGQHHVVDHGRGAAAVDHRCGGIDDGGGIAALYEDGVAGGVAAAVEADQCGGVPTQSPVSGERSADACGHRRSLLGGGGVARHAAGARAATVRVDAHRRDHPTSREPGPAMPGPTMLDRLALVEQPGDVFISASPTDRRHVFGGLLIGQALRAAQLTVPVFDSLSRAAHSLHASFVVAGTGDEHVRYEVERTRDGGSFSTRRVVARQARGVVLVLTADFHDDEPGLEYEVPATPDVPMPEGLDRGRYESPWFDARDVPVDPSSAAPVHARSRLVPSNGAVARRSAAAPPGAGLPQ